jgi:hypothetical protein
MTNKEALIVLEKVEFWIDLAYNVPHFLQFYCTIKRHM